MLSVINPSLVSLTQIPNQDFESSCHTVLTYLHQRVGFRLWMMTRREHTDWIVLQANDHGYGIEEGMVFPWTDSLCSRMVTGLGPRIAPKVKEIPSYATARLNQDLEIGAYIGVPIVKEDGLLFGTLCAIDPQPQDEHIYDELPLIELLAGLLGTILSYDLKTLKQARLLERSQREASRDELTGLLNRRGWEQGLVAEEACAKRYGNPSCVFIIDLDELKQVNDTQGHAQGDILIRKASQSLKRAVRKSDIVARIGGDEFAILALECDDIGSKVLMKNITDTLASDEVKASVGKAMRSPVHGLKEAMLRADKAMYHQKMSRKSSYTPQF
ncbi:MAG: diguanylate cyclase [Microcystaceae cyanobacterium]